MGHKPACNRKCFCFTEGTKRMHAKRFILLALVFTLAAASTCWMISRNRTRVFGHLSREDLVAISKAVRKDLRRYELPTFSRQNLHNPNYVLASVRQYASRRILWVNVEDERTVRVFVGDSKQTIVSDGWSYTLHKDFAWHIGGTSYWGSAELAPRDLKIPVGL